MSEDDARAYAGAVAARLEGLLGGELLGAYLVGSLALGGYEPGRSDVDVAALVRAPLTRVAKEAIVAAVGHQALACPARKLELVVSVPDRLPDFELNLNTGAHEHHVQFEPEASSAFWFAIDASIARAAGVPLVGPPPAAVVPALPRPLVERALRAAIRWQVENRVAADDLVLNACRARRYMAEGVWSSKPDAGAWALERLPAGDRDVVAATLALRRRGSEGAALDEHDAAAFATQLLPTVASH